MKKFRRVYVEITNSCNLNCPFCAPQSRGAHFMSEQLFRQIIPQLSAFTNEITFHVLGEPTIHPKINRFLEICGENKIKVCLTTNGTLIDTVDFDALTANTSQINFSVHSLIQAGITRKHLPEIIFFCEKILSQKNSPYINFRFWDLPENRINEDYRTNVVPVITEIVKNLQPAFDISLLERINTAQRYKYLKLSDRLYLHFNNQFRWPTMDIEPFQEKGFCYALKSHFAILSDGSVTACCLDSSGILSFGNAGEEKLSDILSGKQVKFFQESFGRKILPHELCKRCDYIQRFCGRKENQ